MYDGLYITVIYTFQYDGFFNMNTNAPGQLLGYSLQYPRALYHLLNGEDGDSVCVEVFGDVALVTSDGAVITEEDKSSITGNPLTNRSTNLWKTFYNWIKAIQAGDLEISKTRFILFCNNSGDKALVDAFSDAQGEKEALASLDQVKSSLADISEEHEIWEFFNFTVNENESFE